MKPSAVREQTDGASEGRRQKCTVRSVSKYTPTVGLYLKLPETLSVGSCYFCYSDFGVVGIVLRVSGVSGWGLH